MLLSRSLVLFVLQLVTLDIDDFYTYNAGDTLSIYDGMYGASAPLIITLSGSYGVPTGPYTTTQRYLFIQFTTDANYNQRGFTATFRTKTAGKKLTITNGYNQLSFNTTLLGKFENCTF